MPDDLDAIESNEDPLVGRFVRLVVFALKWPLRFRGTYEGTVVRVRSDRSVDVKLDTDVIAGPVRVRTLYGLPDSSAKVRTGARCVVSFPDANRKSAAVVSWGAGSFEVLEIGTTTPATVIRDGDIVQLGSTLGPITLVDLLPVTPPLPPGVTLIPCSNVKAGSR